MDGKSWNAYFILFSDSCFFFRQPPIYDLYDLHALSPGPLQPNAHNPQLARLPVVPTSIASLARSLSPSLPPPSSAPSAHDAPPPRLMAAGTIRYFEDVTGNLTATVFRDAMNRTSPSNIRISPLVPGLAENQAVLEIRRENATLVLLDFSASINSLGLVTFSNSSSATPRKMEQYLWPMRNKRG